MMPENSVIQGQDLNISFCAMDIPEPLKLGIQELGYVSPTAFQKVVFDHFKSGHNVACLSQSHYGKSLAYNLPILAKVDPALKALQALIICDGASQTELAAKECKTFSRHLGISIGSSLEPYEDSWPQIFVCSADKLESLRNYLLSEQSLATIFFDNLSAVNAHSIINILSAALLGGEVQILIFGNETINAIKDQAKEVLDSVAFVNNSDQPKIAIAAKHMAHIASDTEPKPRALLAALELHQPKSALISCNEASECELLARFLSRYGFRTIVCSEENNTHDVAQSLLELARNNVDILICQNNLLGSIGLEAVPFMLNYDMIERPQNYEQITQFNKQANGLERVIVNLLSNRELGYLAPIKAQCLIEIGVSDLPSSDEILNLSSKRVLALLNTEASLVELAQYEALAQRILLEPEAVSALALLLRNHFLRSAPQAFASSSPRRNERYERNERPMRRERSFRDPKAPHEPRSSTRTHDISDDTQPLAQGNTPPIEGSTRLYVTLGRQDGLADLASLAQFLSEHSGVDLGHFSGSGMVRDRSAHIEVDNEVAQQIIEAVNNSKRPLSDNADNETAAIVCERARQATERSHRRPPMRRNANFQRRR